MAKKYAPPAPDAKLHRPGDVRYLRELLEAAGLSQRKAGPLLGMTDRAIRHKVSGESVLSYPEQYCLEVLADQRSSEMNVVSHSELEQPERGTARLSALAGVRWEPHTVWVQANERALGEGDVGMIVVGEDRFGAHICGRIIRDGFGLVIRELGAQSLDVHDVPVDRVVVYTLVDPRPAS